MERLARRIAIKCRALCTAEIATAFTSREREADLKTKMSHTHRVVDGYDFGLILFGIFAGKQEESAVPSALPQVSDQNRGTVMRNEDRVTEMEEEENGPNG
jgi:hypothetical protein